MTKKGKAALSVIVVVVLSFAGFRGYLWYYDQSNSYVRLEGKDEVTQLIEYKPSLFKLRSAIEAESLTRDEAILKLLTQSFRGFSKSYSGCQIENVFGNVNSHILAQARCKHGA